MGCASAKQTKQANSTLLSGSPSKTGAGDAVLHRIAQVTIKPGMLQSVLDRISDIEQDSSVELKAVVSSDSRIFIQSSVASEADVKLAEEKIDEALKLLSDFCSDEPVHVVAKGGNIAIAGQQIWSSAQLAVVHHQMMFGPAQNYSVSSIIELLNGAELQQQLKSILGLLEIQIILQSDEQMVMHACYVSEASQVNRHQVLELMREVFQDGAQRFHAVGGRVQLAGQQVWSFTDSQRTQPVLEAQESPQTAVAQEILLGPESKNTPQTWLFGSCCVPQE